MSNYVYLMEFDMKTPMFSRRHVPNSIKITSEMVKVGKVSHPRHFEDRMSDYKGTYKCSRCRKSHFSVIKHWELTKNINPEAIEAIIGREFLEHKPDSRCEYYWSKVKNKIRDRISELIENSTQNQPNTPNIKNIQQRPQKTNQKDLKNRTFVRTNKPITTRHAPHNVKRWEWIGEKGRTYDEIDNPNSGYRKAGSNSGEIVSSIDPHLRYDIKNGYIKWE